MDESDPVYSDLPEFDRADRICDEYEQAWLAGQSPQLEAYLSQAPTQERANLRRELESIRSHYESPRSESGLTQDVLKPGLEQTAGAGAGDVVLPARIGRYRIEKLLGQGGFGAVYLARDEQLGRAVAVKAPHARLISRPVDAQAYLNEARTLANLDHPHIVPVYDVGGTVEFPCYIVSKYIEGFDLATRLKQSRLDIRETSELVATVAEALHYAHLQGIVHCDIKPGNILIDAAGAPHVVDFGLALRDEDASLGPRYAGTPQYMSPEQVRGEGHRVDGRSDVFSLGVVLYELLIGRKPFRGITPAELVEQVTNHEPRPLRQCDDRIPKELERICHKALAKRAAERYSTAKDLAEDLRLFLADQSKIQPTTPPIGGMAIAAETHASVPALPAPSALTGSSDSSAKFPPGASSESRPLRIVPKGLRSFDANDADFFLELLPGPRDREGLPDSLRFWKTRLEETDPDQTFPVGVIYGPSGCGKSSLVKAGLLPRLSADVLPVYVEATPAETEQRLLSGVRKRCPALNDKGSLKTTLAALRRGQGLPLGRKVLIVLDQFEQYLSGDAAREDAKPNLVEALRQCDGGRLQCVVLVRDDFWMAITRFMRELELRILEGQNSAAVDLFPLRHAERVLAAFGRAFSALPENPSDVTKEQKQFLQQAAAGLATEDKVICVRLALFAEMMKGKPWTLSALKEVGGATGVGVTFLEETFSAATAPPEHRYHQKAARGVLKALLPASGADIKGPMKSAKELQEASGYARQPGDFDDLMRILDRETRLVTPTDPEVRDEDAESTAHPDAEPQVTKKYFQLTHDYMAPALRTWLTRKQKETRRGRAELRLAERAAVWSARPEHRQLPSGWESLNIRLFTDRNEWTEPQRKMMGQAARAQSLRAALALALVLAVVVTGMTIRQRVVDQRNALRAQGLVDSLQHAQIAQVSRILTEIQALRPWADPLLASKFPAAADGSPEKLRLSLALLPVEDHQITYLHEQLPRCTLDQFVLVRDALTPHKERITGGLWRLAQDEQQDFSKRFQAAAALAAYAPDDERWPGIAPVAAQYLTSGVSAVDLGRWLEHFQAARGRLTESLGTIHADRSRPEKQREAAALALSDYWRDQPDSLSAAILAADEFAEFAPFIAALRPHAAAAHPPLVSALEAAMPERLAKTNDELSSADRQQRDAHWTRQSLAAVALVQLGKGDQVWPHLTFAADPSLRSFIIYHLGRLGADPEELARWLERESDVSIRLAQIQSLGGLDWTRASPPTRRRITEQLQRLFVQDPDPGVHGSAAWALRQWGVTPPETPANESLLPPEHKQRLAEMSRNIADIRRRLAENEQDQLAGRFADWERQLQQQDTPAALSQGLIAHFPLDESQENKTPSALAGQPAGIVHPTSRIPGWIPGVVDRALHLDHQHVVTGAIAPLRPGQPLSLGCWHVSSGTPGAILSTDDKDHSHRGWLLWERPGEIVFEIRGEPPGRTALERKENPWTETFLQVVVSAPEPRRWRHIFVVVDGSGKTAGVSVFLDGERAPPVSQNDNLQGEFQSTVPLHIGSRHGEFTVSGGMIDDVRLYDRRLTDLDVRQIYEEGLRWLALRVPAKERQPLQQALLTAAHRSRDEPLARLKKELVAAEAALSVQRWDGIRRWWVNSQGQTMVVIPLTRAPGESAIDYNFAIASREVTVAEFRRFSRQHAFIQDVSPTDDCPVNSINWYLAAAYCNWLNEQDHVPKDQWTYQANPLGQYGEGMTIRENFQELSGYRLPTQEEWQVACRAGVRGTFCFGEPIPLLARYGRYVLNASGRSHPSELLLPNRAGLFGMHGNLWEWTQTPVSGVPSPVRNGRLFFLAGGSFDNLWTHIRSAYSNNNQAANNFYTHSFRPVRTLRGIP